MPNWLRAINDCLERRLCCVPKHTKIIFLYKTNRFFFLRFSIKRFHSNDAKDKNYVFYFVVVAASLCFSRPAPVDLVSIQMRWVRLFSLHLSIKITYNNAIVSLCIILHFFVHFFDFGVFITATRSLNDQMRPFKWKYDKIRRFSSKICHLTQRDKIWVNGFYFFFFFWNFYMIGQWSVLFFFFLFVTYSDHKHKTLNCIGFSPRCRITFFGMWLDARLNYNWSRVACAVGKIAVDFHYARWSLFTCVLVHNVRDSASECTYMWLCCCCC